MTIKDLKEKIENLPDDMQVGIFKDDTDHEVVHAENSGTQKLTWIHADESEEEIQMFVIQDY
ncbi:hypothetical protein MHM83_11020 [Tenacibaculum sp. Mcav3-52]|uniref:hypothetical protein n=1 Tax=Tenacibaculum sp. Mcav3-52 TaxID=2917762 RepID=UPI001EF1BDCD|nr:hypothetical protein [Tenacibaculum sp. Mcav3-52]MCG7502404.1 hypothetical protein [Tenacibaculum sp. Mcav3-52]